MLQISAIFVISLFALYISYGICHFFPKEGKLNWIYHRIRTELNRRGHIYLLIIAILFTLYYLFFVVDRYYTANANYDLIHFARKFWQIIFKNNFRENFSLIGYPNTTYGADHFSWTVLAFYAPLIRIFRNPALTLVVGQVVFWASAILPFYCIAKKHFQLKNSIIFILGIIYLIAPGFQSGLIFDFHEISLFPLFFFLTFYFYLEKNNLFYWISLVMLGFIKEEILIFIIFFGIFLIFQYRDYKRGFFTFLYGLGAFLILTLFVWPVVYKQRYLFISIYPNLHLEQGIKNSILFFLREPLTFIKNAIPSPLSLTSLFYYLFLIFPFLLKSWAPVLFIPHLLERMFFPYPNLWPVNRFHYDFVPLTLAFLVFLYGNQQKIPRLGILRTGVLKKLPKIGLGYVIIYIFMSNFITPNPLVTPLIAPAKIISNYTTYDQGDKIRDLMNIIPLEASLAAPYDAAIDEVIEKDKLNPVLVSLNSEYILLNWHHERIWPKIYSFYLNSGYFVKLKENDYGVLLKRMVPYNKDLAEKLYEICDEEFYNLNGYLGFPKSCYRYFDPLPK